MKHGRNLMNLPLILFGVASVLACCMTNLTYPGDVDQTKQDVLVVFHEGQEELLIRVHPTFPGLDYGPSRLAWILTVPSTPMHYHAVDPQVFDEAQELFLKLDALASAQRPVSLMPQSLLKGLDESVSTNAVTGSLEVDEPVRVGPYEITPVRARGEEGARALNSYLAEHDFPAESLEELSWFCEREFTFLCIDIHPPEGQERFEGQLELPALQVGFKTARPYYPAKYSARQGDFALALNVLSSTPLQRKSLGDVRTRLRSQRPQLANLFTVKPLSPLLSEATSSLSQVATVKRWFINPVASHGFNPQRDGASGIANWNDDVFFDIGGDGDLPPHWYYGDRELSLRERVWRNRVIRYVSLAVVLLGGFVFVRRRFRRRQ